MGSEMCIRDSSKIEYLKSLEVDAIWLSPIFKSPMNDMGYDVSDYFDIDPLFGNMDDFEELMNICHKNGLKLIIDQVYSHTSDEHPFLNKAKRIKKMIRPIGTFGLIQKKTAAHQIIGYLSSVDQLGSGHL